MVSERIWFWIRHCATGSGSFSSFLLILSSWVFVWIHFLLVRIDSGLRIYNWINCWSISWFWLCCDWEFYWIFFLFWLFVCWFWASRLYRSGFVDLGFLILWIWIGSWCSWSSWLVGDQFHEVILRILIISEFDWSNCTEICLLLVKYL